MPDITFAEAMQLRSEGITLAAERIRLAVATVTSYAGKTVDPETQGVVSDALLAVGEAALDLNDEWNALVVVLDDLRAAATEAMAKQP